MPKALLLIAAALSLWAAASLSSTAHADQYYIFGAVTCDGNRVLARFTGAYNDDDPVFPSPPAEFDRGLSAVQIRDPSACRLNDGRVVRLRHASLGDATPYGMNGGASTEVFTLQVGDQTLFRRAPGAAARRGVSNAGQCDHRRRKRYRMPV